MRSSQEDITLLDRYIKGTLDDQEIRDLEARLATETDLKYDLDELRILAEGMRVRTLASKLEMMRGWEEDASTQSQNNDKPSGSILSIKRILLAASVVLVLIIGWWWMKDKNALVPQKKYAVFNEEQFEENLILHSIKRAVIQDSLLSQEQQKAYQLYSLQLFNEASPLLKELWEKQSDTLALLYFGVSEMGLGHEIEGRQIFSKPELNKYREQIKLFDVK